MFIFMFTVESEFFLGAPGKLHFFVFLLGDSRIFSVFFFGCKPNIHLGIMGGPDGSENPNDYVFTMNRAGGCILGGYMLMHATSDPPCTTHCRTPHAMSCAAYQCSVSYMFVICTL